MSKHKIVYRGVEIPAYLDPRQDPREPTMDALRLFLAGIDAGLDKPEPQEKEPASSYQNVTVWDDLGSDSNVESDMVWLVFDGDNTVYYRNCTGRISPSVQYPHRSDIYTKKRVGRTYIDRSLIDA